MEISQMFWEVFNKSLIKMFIIKKQILNACQKTKIAQMLLYICVILEN